MNPKANWNKQVKLAKKIVKDFDSGKTALPQWLGCLRRDKLGHGERLIQLTSGELAGQVAIVCPTDPDDDGVVTELVYTKADWEAETSASLGFDADGELCWCRPDGSVGVHTVSWKAVR
jgi:hypothetical protein